MQGLGNKKSAYTSEEDRISALTFDHSGQYLSVGDHDGRVIIFKFKEEDAERLPHMNFYYEILAFEPDYDFSGLIEIPSTINALTWVPNKEPAYS